MRTSRVAFVTAAVLAAAAASTSPAQAGRTTAQLRSDLRSTDVGTRVKAFETLLRNNQVSASLGRDLLDLLNRENELIEEMLRAKSSVSERFGEGWGEYHAHVRNACLQYCDMSDTRVFEALVSGGFHYDSPSSVELARLHGEVVVNRLAQRSRSDVPGIRSQAVRMLGVVGEHSQKLSPLQRNEIRSVALRAMADSANLVVQTAGVYAMGSIGTESDVAMLQRIEASDKQKEMLGTRAMYPLRDEASRAIKRINARALVR